jgi:hypothetical protein
MHQLQGMSKEDKMADHALFSPSKMSTTLLCPASISMERALEEQDMTPPPSEYAQHGSMLHKYTYESITKDTRENLKDLDVSDKGAVIDCLDYLEMLKKSIGHNNIFERYEQKVSLKQWGLPEVWGTVDCAIKDNVEQVLHVIDWKFGSGVFVSAWENPQALTYAAGCIAMPSIVKKVVLHIVQPFIDNYSRYDISFQDLFEWVHSTLAVGIIKAKADEPEFNPGHKQCRWCAGKNHCNAHFAWVRENAGRIFRNYEMTHSIPKEELMELIEIGPSIEKAIKEFKAFVTEEIQKGREYEGLKLVEGRSFRKWKDETEVIQWIEDNTELSDMDLMISKFASPAQVEKLDKSLKKNEAFQELYIKGQGKPTLVAKDDPRPALEPANRAVDIFKEYATE